MSVFFLLELKVSVHYALALVKQQSSKHEIRGQKFKVVGELVFSRVYTIKHFYSHLPAILKNFIWFRV